MYRYKIGDVCPFCGQVIPENATPGQLYAISLAANAMKLPEPDHPAPDIICKLAANSCPSGRFCDHRCCRACEKYHKCAHSCENSPTRCRQGKRMTVRGEVVETDEAAEENGGE